MKKLFALLLALVMVLGLVACGNETPVTGDDNNNEAPAASGSVYWLNFKPESDEALQKIAELYTQKTNVPVKVVTAASGTYNETLTAQMDKSDAPTLFVVGNAAAVETWGDYCLDLTGTDIANELSTDAYMLYDADGKLCSIGYCYECYGIIVNKELLVKAGYAEDYITNFATLKEVAEDVHARAAELGFDAFSSAGMDGSSSWRFTGHLINLDYYYESVDAPEAWTSCPASIKGTYMNNYRNLYDLMVVNSATNRADLANGGFDAASEFANGEALFYFNGNWECPDFGEETFYGTAFVTGDAFLNVNSSGIKLKANVATNPGSKFIYNASSPEGNISNEFVTFVDRRKRKSLITGLDIFREEETPKNINSE
ncbi:MAG: ABC transporter substrate-binding protein, partial [Oscillospiraceae bacterium]|nr:ABC transporter substrate-binding protein [Oscillospiraceae bacterium]